MAVASGGKAIVAGTVKGRGKTGGKAEWSKAEIPNPANDAGQPAWSHSEEVRHGR